MKIFNWLSRKSPAPGDPYWQFDPQIHFLPRLNKGDFFRLSGFDFGHFIRQPIAQFMQHRDLEIEKGRSLSYAQKALYYWWYLDAQVTNGGFVQFYYNGYDPYVSTIIRGLEYIGDQQMAGLIKKADRIYRSNQALMEKARTEELFESDLYDRLEGLSRLDDQYYEWKDQTMARIESYLKSHPAEVGVDEHGEPFDHNYSGPCRTAYPDGSDQTVFTLENGQVDGWLQRFYPDGILQEKVHYIKGTPSGAKEEFYENGNLKYRVENDAAQQQQKHQWYYENGHPQKLECKNMLTGDRAGDFREWYENGQLAKSGYFVSKFERTGPWLEYYPDGRQKIVGEFKNGEYLLQDFWDENGGHLLQNGTGLYIQESTRYGGQKNRQEHEYRDFHRHGGQKTYSDGVLSLYQEMQNGREHGITRTYYENGNLREESIYREGKKMSVREFRKYENPIVVTSITSQSCDNCSRDGLDIQIPDNDPQILNGKELAQKFAVDTAIFDAYSDDHVMTYTYQVFVDTDGHVRDFQFVAACNTWLSEAVESSIRQLVFEPGYKDGRAVAFAHLVWHKFQLAE
ncbi:DMP19 family protein [Flavilitoribacter nigricans]|uniref:DNA mimic protein DMP19 C-terminal domain-containing protein n=1 Tax=Flavilitoribacter nigricans (strain ATCC 23147 / DSM 23189 / NBRC 102662 / NCIMB 1420 / SS-2) TaxID=1122177 RepID=A0A2D0NJ16_FLAN2|nr:DUF4375 domain-containing protein [Flavilitoribacter nigricans]PHN08189.1 hypothetical protein CRP01_02385 [Flavilitoribacter nigricans DSM 23189 = NBRC 102662]